MLIKKIDNVKFIKLVIFIIGILSCLVFIHFFPLSNENTDYLTSYKPFAESIISKRVSITKEDARNFMYPLGFPLILSVLFQIASFLEISNELIIFYFSIFCVSTTGVLAFQISNLFFSNRKSLISPLLLFCYPIFMWIIRQPNTETPFILLLFIATYLFFYELKHEVYNKINFFSIGIVLGFMMLIRPIAILCPIIFSLYFLIFSNKQSLKKSIIASLLIITGAFMFILPWEMFMFQKSDKIITLSLAGSKGIYDGLTFNVNSKNYRSKIYLPPDVQLLMENIAQKTTINSSFSELKNAVLYSEPNKTTTIIKLYLIKMSRTLYGTDSTRDESKIFILQIFYLSMIFLSLGIILFFYKSFSKYFLFLIILFLYFLFMSTLVLSIVRYMIPVLALMLVATPALGEIKSIYKLKQSEKENSYI